ncbi:hypothetical protein [Aurantiacibacter zhengii]|uniref:Uncharacterized protein n=1 Tax=Aurantiacibacter zhengii TaxID=2307003 RepID=A0A418NRG3_9SPHN|nr:hypothetical protein [Aurantiacibacter zhengii]RIV85182.1 hypothetical protein D2V07_12955 [Aurantiacibacter zhengii]
MDQQNIPYKQRRNPNLPWGYWCIADPDDYPHLVDEYGRRWPSLREYIWCGRLGMARGSNFEFTAMTEFLLAVLAAIDRRVVYIEEKVNDLFSGSWDVARNYGAWLEGQELAEGLTGGLTPEGRAILVALASTRGAEAATVPIGLPTIAPWRGLDGGDTREERERIVKVNEAFAESLPGRFKREVIARRPGIRLVGAPEGANIPLGRVLWTMTFADEYARDRLFAWLVQRLDRWEAWTQLAIKDGAQAFTEHILRLRFADEVMEAR